VTELRVVVSDDLVEKVARRAADLLRDELAAPRWMTLEEAAEHVRSTANALRWRAQHGRLPGAVKDGSRWLVNARELDDSLASVATIRAPTKRGPRRANGRAPGTGGKSSHA